MIQQPLKEKIYSLEVQVVELQAENTKLRNDKLKLCVTCDVYVQNANLKEALQELYDWQNGPPLLRHEIEWKNAMKMASEALKG